MSKPVVFVDTNCIDNRGSATCFLGGRNDLEKIVKRADILLPRVVYDELSLHVRKFLITQKDGFRRNAFRHLVGISDEDVNAIDIDAKIADLIEQEPIKFRVLDVVNSAKVYREIYDHALNGTAPFEASGDKGFKDTLIAKTIDEYTGLHTKTIVFLMTEDVRLKEYFADKSKVTVISGYSDFDREYSEDKIDEDLTYRIIDFISENEQTAIDSLELLDSWLNWNDDLVAHFKSSEDVSYLVRVDSVAREPLDLYQEDLNEMVDSLAITNNFQTARDNVENFQVYCNFLDEKKAEIVANIFIQNDQIYSIAGDEDVLGAADHLFHILDGFGLVEKAEDVRELYHLNIKTYDEITKALPF